MGYGGTKTEMERLIADANEYAAANGKAADLSIDSFSDIVTAIELIQEKQGIAGTTAREALGTIEGSVNMTKAAWQNLVTEFGKPDADIGARIADMFTAVMGKNGKGGLARNVTNEVRVIATNMIRAIGMAVTQGFDWLVSNGPKLVSNAMQSIGSALGDAAANLMSFNDVGFDSWFTNLLGSGKDMAETVANFVKGIGDSIANNWPTIQENISVLWDEAVSFVQTHGPQILSAIGNVLGSIGSAILEHGPELVGAASDAFASLIEWVTSNGPELVDKAAEIVGNVVDTVRQWLIDNGPAILEAAGTMFGNIASAIVEHAPEILSNIGKTIGKVIGHIVDAAPKMAKAAVEFMGGLISGTSEEGEKLHQWFADLPQNLLNALGDLGTFLLDAGKSLIDGLLDGIGEVAPDVEQAIRDAFQKVLDFFGGVASFIADPIGSIKSGLSTLSDSFWGTESDVNGAMGSAGGAIKEFNDTKLENKSAKATVKGNAIDGTGRSRVNDTKTAINNLSSKDVSVNVRGNVLGDAASKIWDVVGAVRNMASKTVDIVTNNITKNITKNEKHGGAWGGITPRYHATGGVRVADRYGAGVPLDVVGERGPEAIVPLTSHYGADFARMVGEEAAKYMGGPTYILQIGDIEYNTDAAMDAAIDHWFRVAARRAGQYGIG